MAEYTGILGNSALGEITLGGNESSSVNLVRITQLATEVLDVYTPSVLMTAINFELFYLPDPFGFISQFALEVLSQKTQSLILTQESVEVLDRYLPFVFMTQEAVEVLDRYNPFGRITTFSSEVLDVYNPNIRLTQSATEVLYQNIKPATTHHTTALVVAQAIGHSSILNRSVTSAIVIGQIIAGQSYPKTVTTALSVTQTIIATNATKRVFVTSNIHVTPAIHVNEDKVRSITTNITVTPTIILRTQNVPLSVQSNIAIAQTVSKNNIFNFSVVSNISVTQVINTYSGVINVSVSSNIILTHSIAFRNTVVRISMLQPIGASQGSIDQSDVSRQDIESDIAVHSIVVSRNTNVRADVFSTLTLTATVFVRSTIIVETVMSDITVVPIISTFNPNIPFQTAVLVTQTISIRNTVVRLALASNIVVTTKVRTSPNLQSLQSTVVVDGAGFGTAINFYVNPLTFSILQPIYLIDTITGGSSNRNLSVQDNITVSQSVRNNFLLFSVTANLGVSQTIIGGSDTREFSIQDNILVTQSFESRNTINDQSVHHGILLTPTITDITNKIFISVTSNIIANPIATARTVPHSIVRHAIEAHQTILARPDNNRQSVQSDVIIAQNYRYSPNRQSVVQPIVVQQRIQQLDQYLVSQITIDARVTQTRNRLLINQVPITQQLTATRIVNRTIRTNIAVAQTIRANHEYVRTIIQRLNIAESTYNMRLDFSDWPISVPVAIGVIVNATLMTMSGQHGAISLPPPQLGDSIQGIGEIEVRKSMDGTSYSYIQKTDRQKISYKWLLSHLKVYELRHFVSNSISDVLNIINWKGETWVVRITKNPFEFHNQGVWERDREFAEVEMEFEGKKIG